MWIGLAVTASPRIKAYGQSRKNAEEKADHLLRSWLTWEQRRQWRSSREFEVIGCDTGTRYRITQSAVMNIQQLDESGRCIMCWCFMPKGELVRGDVLYYSPKKSPWRRWTARRSRWRIHRAA